MGIKPTTIEFPIRDTSTSNDIRTISVHIYSVLLVIIILLVIQPWLRSLYLTFLPICTKSLQKLQPELRQILMYNPYNYKVSSKSVRKVTQIYIHPHKLL